MYHRDPPRVNQRISGLVFRLATLACRNKFWPSFPAFHRRHLIHIGATVHG
jgi:hypothetical protein